MLSIPQTSCADKLYRRQITSQNLYTLNLAVYPCCSGIYRFVQFILAVDIVVINLANLNIGIDSDRLYTENFQSPVTGKSYVPESGRNMDEQAQTPGGGTSLQHGNITAGAGIFICPSQI